MGPHDDSSDSQSQKQHSDLEISDYEVYRCDVSEHPTKRTRQKKQQHTSLSSDKKDVAECKKNESNLEEDGEDETGNLFRLSVLFVRGNPFDSLKHWRMRCSFLDANLQIGSLGRIREVDEEFLNISEKEKQNCAIPRRGVRLIQVRPKEDEILPVEPKHSERFAELKEFCPEQHYKCNDDIGGLANSAVLATDSEVGKTTPSQNAAQNDTKSRSPTHKSITSLADAVRLPDEQKTVLTISRCEPTFNERTPEDSTVATQNPELVQRVQSAAKERLGFFTKMLRRITALFQRTKIDFRPVRKPQTVRNSTV